MGKLSKDHSKIALVTKSRLQTYVHNALLCGDQQLLGLGDSKLLQVACERLSNNSLEKPHEMPSAQAGNVGGVLHSKRTKKSYSLQVQAQVPGADWIPLQ